MKVLKTIRILLAVLIFASCNLKDDLICPPEYGAALRFHYEGDSGDPLLFGEKINCVSVFVFDSRGELVKIEKAQKEDLGPGNSMTLFIDPGNYRIACWFNATDSYTIFEGYNISDYKLTNATSEYSGDPIDTDDPLYFGRADITVGNKDIVSEDVYLSGAHIGIEIYVEGYPFNASQSNPVIEVTGTIYNYGIMMDRLEYDAQKLYIPYVVYDTQKKAFKSEFNTLRFDNNNNLEILVKSAPLLKDAADVVQINLRQFMLDNNISVYHKNEVKISILISFTDLGVTIGIPRWNEEEVDPSAD